MYASRHQSDISLRLNVRLVQLRSLSIMSRSYQKSVLTRLRSFFGTARRSGALSSQRPRRTVGCLLKLPAAQVAAQLAVRQPLRYPIRSFP